ncbi:MULTISPECIES: TrkH family potassium uptake protein [Caloramator]|uniref:Potassium uptake protein, integral membrane component, KtrB n=1 Tax=Caloramator australicus RC3 TaxID=857293 RepID=I7J4M0_9CLOT|nr:MULTISPECIES: TrkH family potassium uptake protein [Caloramator]MDO6355920.1 TrkH family potassium uptake protein [Caloramator sp. CAR-1]CCJ32746.1 Potassium uptake protein, integral membrane component, KtrB [Caloramator australicus RC3]
MLLKEGEDGVKIYRLQPVQILALGFAAVILIGALLLKLPISSADGNATPFLDCLFTATSAVCVTGLVTLDTGTHWSLFGQVIILLLIQIGGLGFMTFATMFAIILGRKISLKERLIMQEAYNAFNIQGIVKLAIYVMGITFSIEGLGAILLSTQFIPQYGWKRGIYYGIFHSVSAFCNAGFDLIGGFRSLTPYTENVVINLTVMSLIVIGGLGFGVVTEIINNRNFKKLSLHSKVVIFATTILIVTGAVAFFILEYNNPKTLGALSFKGKILSSLFASITPRTAGFNTINLPDMTTASKFLTIILMFIGASPGSTGGGIKTTTATLILMIVLAVIKGREDTEIFERRIPKELVYRAVGITFISFMLVIFVTMVLSITQQGEFMEFMYEATSAFGTVGLSLGLTTRLDAIGKLIIIFTMYSGRVGPLTLALAFARKQLMASKAIKYPEDKILVG